MKNKFKNFLKKANEDYYKLASLITLGLISPLKVFAADSDFQTISKPIVIVGKLIVLIMGLAYLIMGTIWIWLPVLVIGWVKRHYEKKFEDRGEENTKDMLQKMFMGVLGSVILGFIIVGALGMVFFGGNGLVDGIKQYYGGLLDKIRGFMINNLGI